MFKYLGMWDDIGKSKKQGKPDTAKRGAAGPDGTTDSPAKTTETEKKPPSRNCELCDGPLSHTIPAYRCECGKIYHLDCTANIKNCPVCHRVIKKDP